MPQLSADDLHAFLDAHFPEIASLQFRVETVSEGAIRVRMPASRAMLRPGGTVSGPALMSLADAAMYLLLLAHIGPVAAAVTTNLNINFLRKLPPGDVVADARLLKLGRRLAVGEVSMLGAGEGEAAPAAHATVTYAIPQNGGDS